MFSSLDEVGAELNDLLKRVAGGEKTKAEINLSDCVAIQTVGPAF